VQYIEKFYHLVISPDFVILKKHGKQDRPIARVPKVRDLFFSSNHEQRDLVEQTGREMSTGSLSLQTGHEYNQKFVGYTAHAPYEA
jgi:hypothetical protein